MTTLAESATAKMKGRYRDAYRFARVIDFWGNLIKVFGGITGGLIALSPFLGGLLGMHNRYFGLVELILTVLIGAPIYLVFWVAGTLVQAHAQFLKATLDSTINSSPFLSLDEKAQEIFPSLAPSPPAQ
jgi:O-antigen/teichoic acid export membrane protein